MLTHEYETRQLTNRLKTVAGHIRGVKRMVAAHAYCIDIIKQTQAVRHALDKVSSLLLEQHLRGAVTTVLRAEHQPERERVITELLQVFQRGCEDKPDLPPAEQIEERNPQRLAWLEQVEEQVLRIQHMLAQDTYLITVIAEIKAVQRMVDAFESRVLADHLNGCVTTAIRSQQPTERERVVNELLQVFTTGNPL